MRLVVTVYVMLKPEVPDAGAEEFLRTARAAGMEVAGARIGKFFELTVERKSEHDARPFVDIICMKLLANRTIEDYEIVSIVPGKYS